MKNKNKLIWAVTGPSVHSDKVHSMIENYFGGRIYYVVNNNQEDLAQIAEEADILCLAGGSDLFPPLLGRSITHGNSLTKFDIRRDRREINLFKQMVLENGKPCLAICRGFQLALAHFFGFELVQDLTGDIAHSSGDIKIDYENGEFNHFITCEPKFQEKYFITEGCNSFHHQSIIETENSSKDIEIVATANTYTYKKHNFQIVEIAESEKLKLIASAFHPEVDFKYGNIPSNKILERFKEFIA